MIAVMLLCIKDGVGSKHGWIDSISPQLIDRESNVNKWLSCR